MNSINRRFFQNDVVQCAADLVGCELFWGNCRGIIVETEAYAEHDDPACHTATRPSTRAFIRDFPPGTAYVYFNYGMHWMLNVLTKSKTHGNGLILIRALAPTNGIDEMRRRRSAKIRSTPPTHDRWLCSGPGKLTAALAITGNDHGRDLCGDPEIGFRKPLKPRKAKSNTLPTPHTDLTTPLNVATPQNILATPNNVLATPLNVLPTPQNVLATPRIGISKAIDFPWRFHLANCLYVSV